MNLKEEDIRTYIENWLRQKGIATEREVACGNGVRADLVTPDTVIEVKKQLTRGTIYQAYGQGVAYQTLLKKPKLIIIGLAPSSEARYQEAQRIAENVRSDKVEVVFIDKDPKWKPVHAAITAQASLPPELKSPAQSTDPLPDQLPAKLPDQKSQSAVRLPFEVAAASVEAEPKPAASGEPDSAKPAAPAAKPASRPTSQPHGQNDSSPSAVFVWKDIWKLLLLILVFLWIRAYIWRISGQPNVEPNSQLNNPPNGQENLPVQLDSRPQPDPSPTPFTIPSVPQK